MSFSFPYSGPIPPYTNVAIDTANYSPRVFTISAITLGVTTTITTTSNMNYVVGQEVKLIIPNNYGCVALNQQTGFVIAIPASNQVNLNINSLGVTPYINANLPTKAQIIAIGDVNTGAINTSGRSSLGTSIPGSFINISS